MSKKCEHCGEPATIAGLCKLHYNYAYRWNRAGVARAREHGAKLAIRASIIMSLTPGQIVPTNVVEITTHPRFAPKRVTTAKKRGRKRRAG